MTRRAVLLLGSVGVLCCSASLSLSTKLDPALAAMLDDPQAEADREVVVMVGLAQQTTEQMLAELQARGLSVRSVLGDRLNATARLGRIGEIGARPAIVKIEASTPLHPETPPAPGS